MNSQVLVDGALQNGCADVLSGAQLECEPTSWKQTPEIFHIFQSRPAGSAARSSQPYVDEPGTSLHSFTSFPE